MYKYLRADNTALVFGDTVNISDELRIRKTIMKPKALNGLAVHEDVLTYTWPKAHDVCGNSCTVTATEKVSVLFSGPLSSKAEKVARLLALVNIIQNSDDAQNLLSGYPVTPLATFDVTTP